MAVRRDARNPRGEPVGEVGREVVTRGRGEIEATVEELAHGLNLAGTDRRDIPSGHRRGIDRDGRRHAGHAREAVAHYERAGRQVADPLIALGGDDRDRADKIEGG